MKMHRGLKPTIAALAVLSLAFAGCGDSTSEDIEQMEGGGETGIQNDVEDVPGQETSPDPAASPTPTG